MPAIVQLIWWIADNDIEFHVKDTLRLVSMNESIGMAFQFFPPFIGLFAGSAVHATPVGPGVLHAPEPNISFGVVEGLADGILSVGRLGAVNGPPRKQGGQLRDGESVELVLEDVVYPLLAVGDLLLKPLVEPLGDFTQEDAGFAAGI